MAKFGRLHVDDMNLSRRKIPVQLILAAVFLISAVGFGLYMAQGRYTVPFLIAIGVFAAGLMIREPILGFYLSLVIALVVPYQTLRLPFPLLHSPLSVIVILMFLLAIARFVIEKKPLTPTNLYLPIFLWVLLLLVFVVVGHGPAATTRALWSLGGIWPFFLVILLVDTPRRARNVLLALIIPLMIVAIAWLPALLSRGGFSGASIKYSGEGVRSLFSTGTPRGGAAVLLTYVGGASWQVFSIIALVWTVLFSIAMFAKTRIRWLAGLAAAFLLLLILLCSFGNALLVLVVGALFVVLFGRRRLTRRNIGFILALIGLVAGLLLFTSSERNVWNRVFSGEDPSVEARKIAWEEGTKAFLANPIIGWGAYNEEHQTESGNWLLGHSGFLVSAYEYGLVYLATLCLLFFMIAKDISRLARKRLSSTDRAIVIGIQALFATYIVQFFISGSLGLISIDIVFWLFIGLACVWLNWLQSDDESRLVE